jgi:TonB-dependent starch-binding outer membrane protein SusC
MFALYSSSRVLLSSALLVALVGGCAHGRGLSPRPQRDATVTAEDIARAPGQPIEKILMAHTPGLWATRTPDGGIALRIRGISTLRGGGEPLYVLDGMPTLPGPNGKLNGIDPYDIESVSVLKETEASSIYGLRGAYGAIVIKTKRGDW